MANYNIKLQVDTSQHDAAMKRASGQVNYYADKVLGAKDKLMTLTKAVPILTVAIGGVTTAFKILKSVMESADSTGDDFHRTIAEAQSVFNNFKISLANANFSGFITQLNDIRDAAREAFDAADELGTMVLESEPQIQAWRADYEKYRAVIYDPESTKEEIAEATQWLKDNKDTIKIIYQNITDVNTTDFVKKANLITNNVLSEKYYEEHHLYGYNDVSKNEENKFSDAEKVFVDFFTLINDYSLATPGENPWDVIFPIIEGDLISVAISDINKMIEAFLATLNENRSNQWMQPIEQAKIQYDEAVASGDNEKIVKAIENLESIFKKVYKNAALETKYVNGHEMKSIFDDEKRGSNLLKQLVSALGGYSEVITELEVLHNVSEDPNEKDEIDTSKTSLLNNVNAAATAQINASSLQSKVSRLQMKKPAAEVKAEEAAKEAAEKAKAKKEAAEAKAKEEASIRVVTDGSLTDLENKLSELEEQKQVAIDTDDTEKLKDILQQIVDLKTKISEKKLSLGLTTQKTEEFVAPNSLTSLKNQLKDLEKQKQVAIDYNDVEKTKSLLKDIEILKQKITEKEIELGIKIVETEDLSTSLKTLQDEFYMQIENITGEALNLSGAFINLGQVIGDAFDCEEVTNFFNTLQGGLDILDSFFTVYQSIANLLDMVNSHKKTNIALTEAQTSATTNETNATNLQTSATLNQTTATTNQAIATNEDTLATNMQSNALTLQSTTQSTATASTIAQTSAISANTTATTLQTTATALDTATSNADILTTNMETASTIAQTTATTTNTTATTLQTAATTAKTSVTNADILATNMQVTATTAQTAASGAASAANMTEISTEAGKGLTKAVSSSAGVPFPYNLMAIAMSVAAVVSALSMLGSIGKFAEGGVVGGNTTVGDRTLARVNKGEMILNSREQTRLFNIVSGIDSMGTTGSIGGDVKFRISGSDLVGVLNNQQKKKSRAL